MKLANKLGAEFFGTFWLVFGGAGSAVLAAGYPELGIGFVGVSLAFGLTVLTMIYAVGHISGAHFNPAVSIGLWLGGRFEAKGPPRSPLGQVSPQPWCNSIPGRGPEHEKGTSNRLASAHERRRCTSGYHRHSSCPEKLFWI